MTNQYFLWTKTYVGAHDVFYKGFRERKGIWGTWTIRDEARVGFHIWPLGSDGVENKAKHEEDEMPAELSSIVPRLVVVYVAYLSVRSQPVS